MTEKEMEAIAGGFHGDPFRVLGPHRLESGANGDTWVVRRVSPASHQNRRNTAAVRTHGTHASSRVVRALPAHNPGAYRLRLTDHEGQAKRSRIHIVSRLYQLTSTCICYGEGTHYESYRTFGAHLQTVDGVMGTRFAVWAPNAIVVSVVGEFNGWDHGSTRCGRGQAESGRFLFRAWVPGTIYKYAVRSRFHGYSQMKADPYGFAMEVPPKSASVVVDVIGYEWQDHEWLKCRGSNTNGLTNQCRFMKFTWLMDAR